MHINESFKLKSPEQLSMSSFGPSRTKHESQFVQIFKNLENKQGQNRSVTDENYPYFKQISK